MQKANRSGTAFDMLRRTAILAVFATGVVGHAWAQCETTAFPSGKHWSPDCRAYFVNETIRPPFGKTERLAPRTVSVSSAKDRKNWIVGDPTQQLRNEIAGSFPTCIALRVDINAMKWIDSKNLLIAADLTCGKNKEHRMYALNVSSGESVAVPYGWVYVFK